MHEHDSRVDASGGEEQHVKNVEDSVAFEMSVSSRDGGVLKKKDIMRRIMAVYECEGIKEAALLHAIFIVTADAPLFVQKSYILPQATFIVGAGTMLKVLDNDTYDLAERNGQKKKKKKKRKNEQGEDTGLTRRETARFCSRRGARLGRGLPTWTASGLTRRLRTGQSRRLR